MSRHHRYAGQAKGAAWERVRQRVLIRDRHRCVQCGRPGRFEIHHVRMVSQGGSNEPDNLVALCRGCHLAKHPARVSESRRAWRDLVAETSHAP